MSETLRTLALEILKSKNNFNILSNTDIHKIYREIYAELKQAEKDYVQANPNMRFLK